MNTTEYYRMSVSYSDKSIIQKWFRTMLEYWIEHIFRMLFFWESDDKRIGILIRYVHSFTISFIFISYIIAHTIIPSYWLMFSVWISIMIIWIHHILTGSCVFTRIEQRLINDKVTLADPLLQLFDIPITNKNAMTFTYFISTISVVTISLELFTRTLLNVKSVFTF
jgi:hypothetical protein